MESQIRPVNARGNVEIESIQRDTVQVPNSVIPWCMSNDWDQKLDKIISKTDIYNASFRSKEKVIVLVGKEKAVKKANSLMSFVMDHQKDISLIDAENMKLQKKITDTQNKIKAESVEEVLIDKDLVGIIIGKSGATISSINQEFGVNVQIHSADDQDLYDFTDTEIPEDKALVRVIGNNRKWMKEAIDYINIRKGEFKIPKDKIEYVKGSQMVILNDLKNKSGCFRIFVHEARQGEDYGRLEAIGNEEALDQLKLLYEQHLEYYSTYQEKEEKGRELSKKQSKYNNYGDSFYSLDGGYRGRGNGRGGKNRR